MPRECLRPKSSGNPPHSTSTAPSWQKSSVTLNLPPARCQPRFAFVNRHPWLLVGYLFGVTLASFLVPAAWKPLVVAALLVFQLSVLALAGAWNWRLLDLLDRLKFLFAFLIGANALLPGAATDTYWVVSLFGTAWQLRIDLTGLATGILMSAQIALVVLTTHVVRTIGNERAFINGLRSLRVAPLLAYSLDTTLAMLDGSLRGSGGGGGGGRGDGSGGGTGGGHHVRRAGWFARWRQRQATGQVAVEERPTLPAGVEEPGQGVLALFRALRRRDLSPLIARVNQGLHDAAKHAERLGLSEQRAHDVGVIGGVAAAMMAFKLVKVLPGMPVMQGAKTIFFIPMYMLAADRTKTRWGGTMAGGIMGFIAFLNGDSRYGVFEVLKHLVPGLVIDLLWPIVRLFPLRFWILVLVGLLAAAARTSTQFAMILCLGVDNATLLVFPAFKLIPNCLAGLLSALVSYPLLKHLGRDAIEATTPELVPATEVSAATDVAHASSSASP